MFLAKARCLCAVAALLVTAASLALCAPFEADEGAAYVQFSCQQEWCGEQW